jgi:hypothetical protein
VYICLDVNVRFREMQFTDKLIRLHKSGECKEFFMTKIKLIEDKFLFDITNIIFD